MDKRLLTLLSYILSNNKQIKTQTISMLVVITQTRKTTRLKTTLYISIRQLDTRSGVETTTVTPKSLNQKYFDILLNGEMRQNDGTSAKCKIIRS